MSLQKEIDKNRAEIRSDGYSMSIGELISLYQNDEIDIHPEFQRFFRWSNFQKSRLIESILLGIPIPQIFVAQREDGLWDVVDGLQRLSTIYQLLGILRDETKNLLEPLTLDATKYLPSLQGKRWEDPDPNLALTTTQRLLIKRAKLDVNIILRESTESTKYELFQRLNTGGSQLSEQEVRNSILVMVNKDIYTWLKELSKNEYFQECLSLTDRAIDEQYDAELALRFVIFRNMPEDELKKVGDLGEFLTEKMIEIAENKSIDLENETKAFIETFKHLREQLGVDSFKKYNTIKSKFLGGFLVSAYEIVAIGLGYNYPNFLSQRIDIPSIVKKLWENPNFTSKSGSGIRASSRIPNTIPLGREAFRV